MDKIKIDYEITMNEILTIELISNPSTGYSWKWVNESSGSHVKKVNSIFTNDNPERIGSAGKEKWEFKAIKHGVDTLKFEYSRTWDSDSTIESQEIIIKVTSSC